VSITSSDQDAVAHNLEHESLLRTPDDIENDGFIINLYPLHRYAFCLLVGRFSNLAAFLPYLKNEEAVRLFSTFGCTESVPAKVRVRLYRFLWLLGVRIVRWLNDLAQEFFRACPTNIASVTTDDSHYPEQNVTELTGLVTSAGGSLLFSLVFSDSIQSHVTQGMALWTLQWRRDALQVEGKVIGSPVLGSL
jgi:hypothetical protein